MNLTNKQITFYKPTQVSACINEGIRALAESCEGSIQAAGDHCLMRVKGLTEARLTRIRSKSPPKYTRDGQSFVTLVWVLLVDGLQPYRQPQAVRAWFVSVIEATDLFEGKLTDDHLPVLIELFIQSMGFHEDISTPTPQMITHVLQQVWTGNPPSQHENVRHLPLFTRLFVGREADVAAIHQRLGVGFQIQRQPLTIVRGWPGVGKTALINTIAHDDQVKSSFADGLLWMSLGRNGDVFSALKSWAKQLGALHLLQLQNLPDLLEALRMTLIGRDLLIIVDDVWTAEQGLYIKRLADLKANTLLLTTRFTDVAIELKDLPDDIYLLDTLSQAHAIDLLKILAPQPVRAHQERMPQLVKVLEGLPLALRVAGPMLQYYYSLNFGIDDLIDEFENDYNRLLNSTAPNDRFDEETGQTPTIELLFQRSVETLSAQGQEAFATLGVFKHKPATFSAKALQDVWEIENPKVLIETLIGRGLMDVTPNGRYHVHQTLHMYANKLLDLYDEDYSDV